MISVFLEHYTIKTARRALLVTSFIAIMLPSLTITGDGLDISGLTMKLEQASLLTASRLISAYFLWIFIWLNVAHFANSARNIADGFFEKLIEKARASAHEVDVNPYGEDSWTPDREPWWEYFATVQSKLMKRKNIVGFLSSSSRSLAVILVEYLPPLVLACLAIFVPEGTNSFIFSMLNTP